MHKTLGTSHNKTLRSRYGDLTEEEKAWAKESYERVLMSQENISKFDTAIARVEMLRESCKVINETLINKQKDVGTQERQHSPMKMRIWAKRWLGKIRQLKL